MIGKLIDVCIRNRVLVLLLLAFGVFGGVFAMRHVKIDAIPDLSDVQVIVRTDFAGQAPQIVEDQVTYPLTTAMLAVPFAKDVRGYSMFGASYVYVIFADGTDPYWARSRVLEQLSAVTSQLPAGVVPQLGPDATGVGWIFEYVLVTGRHCPNHADGVWEDPPTRRWFGSEALATLDDQVRARLVHHRIFEEDDAHERCPVDGAPLVACDVDLGRLRGLQDWFLRFELTATDGVSEVASIGGFVKQYQIVVDPVKLLALDIPLDAVKTAVQRSNLDAGGGLVELSEREYMVRGIGYLGSLTQDEITAARSAGKPLDALRTARVLHELGRISVGVNAEGAPVWLGDVAELRVGPEMRRGVIDWNGSGEAVGGIVVMRAGENARDTIAAVRAKLPQLERGLPAGVAIRTGYDRSDLIDRSVHTLIGTLIEEILVVSAVCLLFLLHARSALVAVIVLPTGVLLSLLAMYLLGINANIMSLGGIAIAIGVMVDSSIVMVENAHKHLEQESARVAAGGVPRSHTALIADAAREVGPSLFFSLLVVTLGFLPVFALGEQSGRLFKPLAWTKTLAMTAAAFLAVTIIPVLMTLFVRERMTSAARGRLHALLVPLCAMAIPAALLAFVPWPALDAHRRAYVIGWIVLSGVLLLPQRILSEERNPLSRLMERIYDPFFALAMRLRWAVLIGAVLLVGISVWPLSKLGSEFMPPLEEGDLLYMPTTDPGLSVDKARELLQQTDAILATFPEVESVLGKIGSAETATDPAPPNMLETTITLHRDPQRWRHKPVDRFYADWPESLRALLRPLWPDSVPITSRELVYGFTWADGTRVPGMNDALQIPGLTNAWTMPIRTRIDMLATGIRTPIGVKVMGPDLDVLERIAVRIADSLRTDPVTGANTVSAFPEKAVGGSYLDVRIDREAVARHGILLGDVQELIMGAIGGMNIAATVEGRERYPVNLRYPHELRDNLPALRQTLVPAPSGTQVPLGQLAELAIHEGPAMVKSENARLTAWIFVDIHGIDLGTYVARAKDVVARTVSLPAGYTLRWSGQFEYLEAANERLAMVLPITAVGIVLLLYLATRSWLRVSIVLLAVPFSMVGAVWFLWYLDYEISLAVWVGMIALAGLDAETGLVMLLYLERSFERFRDEGRLRNADDLWLAVHDGAVKRIRPKTMTVLTTFVGLVPLLWATGAGADTMRRLAAPMIGGLATSFVLELLIYPVVFYLVKRPGLATLRVSERDA
ncbi:MAG: efflux RND transporter permease subunit [Planctomycetota bacterium]